MWDPQVPATSDRLKTAVGIGFVALSTGEHLVARASGEVILSAGSLQTPQLLELSGVGSPSLLSSFGIETVIDLPGVGANLQDHPTVISVYKLKPGFQSLDHMVGAALAAAVNDYSKGEGILTQALSLLAFAPSSSWLSGADRAKVTGLVAERHSFLPEAQRLAQVELYEADASMVEFIPINVDFSESGRVREEPDASYVSLATCLQHSFARGNVHLASADPLTKPAIDPNCALNIVQLKQSLERSRST